MPKIAQIENYIAYQKSVDKSPATVASYRSDLLQFAVWFESVNGLEMRLLNITPTDARQYKQHLIDSGLRPQTINRRLLSLKYFIEWGWSTKKIKYRIPFPQTVKQSQTMPKWLSRIQQNQLLRHIERYGNIRNLAIAKVLVTALAGHKRLDTTKLYCHPSFADLSDAVERIGELD